MTNRKKATEIEWLKFFYENSDFGPADEDIRYLLKERFMNKTGKEPPEGYSTSEDEEDDE